ncbi:MAG: PH domain-containing protein [Pseudomonadota bacterium]
MTAFLCRIDNSIDDTSINEAEDADQSDDLNAKPNADGAIPSAFTNLEIAPQDLPQASTLETSGMESAYVSLAIAFAVIRWFIAAIVAIVVIGESELGFHRFYPWLAVPAVLLLAVLDLLFSRRAAMVKRYAVREHDVYFESGVFWHAQTIQPLNRVQHVEVGQGPIDKRLGLAHLQLFSSGSGAASLNIPGLTLKRAEELREFILQHRDTT